VKRISERGQRSVMRVPLSTSRGAAGVAALVEIGGAHAPAVTRNDAIEAAVALE